MPLRHGIMPSTVDARHDPNLKKKKV
jgi:hypothetical protein